MTNNSTDVVEREQGLARDIEWTRQQLENVSANGWLSYTLTHSQMLACLTALTPTNLTREGVARIIAEDDVKSWSWDEDAPPDAFENAVAEQTPFHLPTADRVLSLLQGSAGREGVGCALSPEQSPSGAGLDLRAGWRARMLVDALELLENGADPQGWDIVDRYKAALDAELDAAPDTASQGATGGGNE